MSDDKKPKNILKKIEILVYEDGTSTRHWSGDFDLGLWRNVLTGHLALVSEQIGVIKYKADEKKIKVVGADKMPRMELKQ